MGVGVIVENLSGSTILKCKVSELLSPSSLSASNGSSNSSSGPLKVVKFRVEFLLGGAAGSPSMGSSPRETYPTTVLLCMEKGAHSTFKATFNRLRAVWEYVPPPLDYVLF